MPTPAPCVFETTHARPCLLCRGAGSRELAAHDPSHPGHLEAAEAIDRLTAQQLFAERGLFLEPLEVADLRDDVRKQLDAWALTDAPVPPAIAACAHVADVVIAGDPPRQPCTRCRLVLQDHAAIVEDGAYPVGARVGLDCDGRPADFPPDVPGPFAGPDCEPERP